MKNSTVREIVLDVTNVGVHHASSYVGIRYPHDPHVSFLHQSSNEVEGMSYLIGDVLTRAVEFASAWPVHDGDCALTRR